MNSKVCERCDNDMELIEQDGERYHKFYCAHCNRTVTSILVGTFIPPETPKSLGEMTALELEHEVLRLYAGIRAHRDEQEQNRCYLDDERLYALLPEGVPPRSFLTDKQTFLSGCERYYELRCKK